MSNKWVKVGEVGVDSGHIMISDPAYGAEMGAAHFTESQQASCEPNTYQLNNGIVNLAVSMVSGHGDSIYPVYVRYDDEGFITEAKIDFRLS